MVRLTETKCCDLLLLCMIMFLSGCSAGSSPPDAKSGPSGGIAFRLAWNDGQPQKAMNDNRQLMTDDICANYHIQWISAKAIDHLGNEQSNGKWLCTERHGELSDLPEGTYTVVIQGEVNTTVTWRGETSGIEVFSNQKTDAGQVAMTHLFDHDAPAIVETVPADGEPGVPVNGSIAATFDNAIVGASITSENFFLALADQSEGTTSIEGMVSYDAIHHTAVLTPAENLQNNTTYTATIAVDKAQVVEDTAANPMQQAVQWTFTTSSPDNEAPRVETRSPGNGEMNLDLQAIVQIRFSESINPLTITSDSIFLHCNGGRIQCALSYDNQLHMVTLSPAGDLPAGSTCQVEVTTDVADLSGNTLESNDTWAFVTRFPLWHTEDIDRAQKYGIYRIAIVSNDMPLISTTDTDGEVIALSRTAQNTWEEKLVPCGINVNHYYDMTISPRGASMSHLLWSTSNTLNLCSHTIDPGATGVMLIGPDNPQLDPRGVSIAVADNVPDEDTVEYACYYDANDSQLVFAAKNTNWAPEIVDTQAGESPSLAAEPTGAAHISYSDPVNGYLKYATNKSGAWVIETIDNSGQVDSSTAIALDASGRPHISYRGDTNKRMKYATKQPSGDWLRETVDDTSEAESYSSIAIDLLGLAHIVYRHHGQANLMYAAKTTMGAWHREEVDTDCSFWESSIVVDNENFIHIAYGYKKTAIAYPFVRYATTRPQN